jgi:putative transcriptional regulator
VPEHTHDGRELTLVLAGSFRDGKDVFARGDIEEADDTLLHQPVATEEEDCICLAVTEAPLKFTSWIVRLIQPILKI